MPKDTFLNLPKEKQERIIDAAIDEFATHSFHQARVTAIAEQAEIAVGSFTSILRIRWISLNT